MIANRSSFPIILKGLYFCGLGYLPIAKITKEKLKVKPVSYHPGDSPLALHFSLFLFTADFFDRLRKRAGLQIHLTPCPKFTSPPAPSPTRRKD
jgi:hypothetical protein